ncbi:protein sisterless A [Drosophila grimshawi]|uniref:GH12223 n=1 Tax=Drosophila grimshawi TaxID=7222 RepID=B4JJM3_DROGR|nr:protein sisterless A [Drosophila grimshawi]EDV99775.1 GH12223 [Drosophila grimshawi]
MEQTNIHLNKFYSQLGHRYNTVHGGSVHPVKVPALHSNKPEQIDELVAMELQHLKTHYADEEQRYVDQMLIENPIVVERRAPPTKTEATQSQVQVHTQTDTQTVTGSRDAQRQRAESCRKSRYNNKIKKAKLRFRHKFVCSQLTESAGALDYMREVIAQAESQLLARGFSRAALERMRQNFGVDRCGAAIMTMDH